MSLGTILIILVIIYLLGAASAAGSAAMAMAWAIPEWGLAASFWSC